MRLGLLLAVLLSAFAASQGETPEANPGESGFASPKMCPEDPCPWPS